MEISNNDKEILENINNHIVKYFYPGGQFIENEILKNYLVSVVEMLDNISSGRFDVEYYTNDNQQFGVLTNTAKA